MASKEYLEEIWQLAKKTLPGWAYATLHAQAKAKAGGLISHKTTEPNSLEGIGMACLEEEHLKGMSKDAVLSVWKQLDGWYTSALRKKKSPDAIKAAAKQVVKRMNESGFNYAPSALVSELTSLSKASVPIAFVGACPDTSEDFVEVLITKYLQPLKLAEKDFWLFDLVPIKVEPEAIDKSIGEWGSWSSAILNEANPTIVVALGKLARRALGDKADFSLPHPMALTKFHDSGELGRKLKQIKRKLAVLDKSKKERKTVINSPRSTGDAPAELDGRILDGYELTQITKADNLKKIVYGIVMDPYGIKGAKPDAHNDFILPSTIEDTAHNFLLGDRVIGRQHEKKTNAQVVESWIEMYPSPAEYKKAISGQDHTVWRRPFGTDVAHSGSWILGVKLGESEWNAFEKGELNAFSPGGAGFRQKIEPSQMPNVKFIDLVEQTNG